MESLFEAQCGSNSEWVRLFEQSKDFMSTELIVDADSTGRYMTLDFWTSRQAYEQCRHQHTAEYKQIDAQCGQLTVSETEIGDLRGAGQVNFHPDAVSLFDARDI